MSRRGPQGGEAPLGESGRTLRGALRGGGPNGDGGSRAGMGGSFRSLVLFLRFDCSASSSVLSAPSFFCTSESRDAGNCRREAIDGLLEAPFGCPGGRLAKLGIRKARSFALDSPRISFRLLSPWTFPIVLGLLFRPPFLVLPRFQSFRFFSTRRAQWAPPEAEGEGIGESRDRRVGKTEQLGAFLLGRRREKRKKTRRAFLGPLASPSLCNSFAVSGASEPQCSPHDAIQRHLEKLRGDQARQNDEKTSFNLPWPRCCEKENETKKKRKNEIKAESFFSNHNSRHLSSVFRRPS